MGENSFFKKKEDVLTLFLAGIDGFTKHEKKLIESFHDRVDILFDYQKRVRGFIQLAKNYRDALENNSDNIRQLKKSLDEEGRDLFHLIRVYIESNLKAEETNEKVESKILFKENNLIERVVNKKPIPELSEKKIGIKVRRKVRELNFDLRNFRGQAIEMEKINEYFSGLIESLFSYVEREKKILEEQVKIIAYFVKHVPFIENNEILPYDESLNKLRFNMKKLLRAEKTAVIDKFEEYFKIKIHIEKVLEDLSKKIGKEKLTKSFIKSEFEKFSKISEKTDFINYLSSIEQDSFDDPNAIEKYIKNKRKAIRVLQRRQEVANQKLKKMATIDALTGVFNRGQYDRGIVEIIDDIKRGKLSGLSFLMIDIDFFKKFNDTFGHYVGDITLAFVAQKIKNAIRQSDKLYRYGGEEFCILIREKNGDRSGEKLGNKIRKIIEKKSKDFMEPINESTGISKPDEINISIGVSSMGKIGKFSKVSIEKMAHEVKEAADKALYHAKEKGRNCVVVGANFEF